MIGETHKFLRKMEEQNQEFVKQTQDDLLEKGFKVQIQLAEKITSLEGRVTACEIEAKNQRIDIKLLSDKIDEEYREFARNRKRWKSEFGLATDKADAYMAALKQTLEENIISSKANKAAIKLLLDSQMIDHLIQK